MERWTGEVVPMQVGCNWTYKLWLQASGGEPKSELVLGRGVFPNEEAARAAAAEHLQSELDKRTNKEAP